MAACKVKRVGAIRQIIRRARAKASTDWISGLAKACTDGDFEVVQCLFMLYCDDKIRQQAGITSIINSLSSDDHPLMHNAASSGNIDIVHFLLKQGVIATRSELTPLDEDLMCQLFAQACSDGNITEIRWMINLFPELATAEHLGRTPLFYACVEGHLEIIQFLRSKFCSFGDKHTS